MAYQGLGSTDVVCGVLFDIDCAEKADLDRVEGLGVGYLEWEVPVVTERGERMAWTYVAKADQVNPALRPEAWYKAHVLRGAREHRLPKHYVEMIERVEVAA